MIVVNFSHPLTPIQIEQITKLVGTSSIQVVPVNFFLNISQPILPQIEDLLSKTPLSSVEWQTKPILVNLPGLSLGTAILLAVLHGMMGYFPPVIHLKPVNSDQGRKFSFEVAEIVNLQPVRDNARSKRIKLS